LKKKFIFFSVLLILLSIFPFFIYSQENTTNTNKVLFQYKVPAKETDAPSYISMVFKTLLILGVFGIGIYYFAKYISKKQGLAFPHLNIIKIITSIPVGTNRFIQIIEIGNKYYLIGSTDNSINLLTEIIDKETINMIKILKNKQVKKVEYPSFSKFLNNLIGGFSKKTPVKENSSFIKKQKDRLKKFLI